MTDDLLDLKGRVALVTGAGQGVGRQVALHFAKHNAGAVIVNDFFVDRAAAVALEVENTGTKAMVAQADVTDLDAMIGLAVQAHKEFDAIDILVNNAGNMGPDPNLNLGRPFWEQTTEDWNRSIDVNLFGVLNATRAVLPGMIERSAGSIVTVVSDAGRVGEPRLEAYSAAKAGAAGFVRAIARTVGRYNVRANCVALSATKTPTVRLDAESERGQRMLRPYILRRFGEPEDAANMILYLASDAASWITGQTYPVNGGYALAT